MSIGVGHDKASLLEREHIPDAMTRQPPSECHVLPTSSTSQVLSLSLSTFADRGGISQ
jgi:hypothetical protein